MENIRFFTAVTYPSSEQTFFHTILETVDSCFYFGGRKVQVVPGVVEQGSQGVMWKTESTSHLTTAIKIASYCTIVIPLIAILAKTILRSFHHFHIIEARSPFDVQPPSQDLVLQLPPNSEEVALPLIQQFWEKHVHSFSMKHGTSALYLNYFKEHGISATYPEALDALVTKVRKVWKSHEHDVAARTDHFLDFEDRYDRAKERHEIELYFTADGDGIDQYTTGERGHGGEWIKELRHFLFYAQQKEALFSEEEREVLAQSNALSEVMMKIPPMVVKIRGGSPAYSRCFGETHLCPLDTLVERVKRECPEWQKPEQLTAYLDSVVFPELGKERNRIESRFQCIVSNPIPPEELDFEICGKLPEAPEFPSRECPVLDFDAPRTLSLDDAILLRIHQLPKGLSDKEEFMESFFEIEYQKDDLKHVIVTRRKCSGEELKAHALFFEQKKLRAQWLRAFGFDERVA